MGRIISMVLLIGLAATIVIMCNPAYKFAQTTANNRTSQVIGNAYYQNYASR